MKFLLACGFTSSPCLNRNDKLARNFGQNPQVGKEKKSGRGGSQQICLNSIFYVSSSQISTFFFILCSFFRHRKCQVAREVVK